MLYKKQFKIFFSLIFIFSFFLLSFSFALAQDSNGYVPSLQYRIGNFGGENDFDDGRPGEWISLYIVEVYRYGVGIAAFLAVVMLMVGGLIWLTSAGRRGQIETGQDFIKSALSGLLLALFSFILLNTINPRLTVFQPLDIAEPNFVDPYEGKLAACCTQREERGSSIKPDSCIQEPYTSFNDFKDECQQRYGNRYQAFPRRCEDVSACEQFTGILRGCCYRTGGPQNRIVEESCTDIFYLDYEELINQCNDIYGTGVSSATRSNCECGNTGAF